MSQPQARAFEQLLTLAKQVDFNTPKDPDTVIPVTGGGISANIPEIYDEGRRGVPAAEFAAFPDAGQGDVSVESLTHPDRIGHFLMGVFGRDDVTGVADPTSHVFTAIVDPPAYTVEDIWIGGSNGALRCTGVKWGSISFSFDGGQNALTYSVTGIGKIPSVVTPIAVPLGIVSKPWAGWRGTFTSAGMTGRVISGDISFNRELGVVHTMRNSQDPFSINHAPMRVEGSLVLAVTDLSDVTRYLLDTQQAITIAFAQVEGQNRSLTMQMTLNTFSSSAVTPAREAVVTNVNLGFRGLFNATDTYSGGPGGPAKVTLVNGRTTTY